jgi:aldose 1-epimerase
MVLAAGLSALSLGAMLTLSACSDKAAKTVSAASATAGVTAVRGDFGKLSDGTAIESVTLKNTKGITLKLITYGAAMQSLMVPDKAGTPADIIIGYDSIEGYEKTPNYTNVTVGRYANRIAGGKFTLEGKTYTLPLNDKTNTLHGGPKGWDKHVWAIKDVQQGADQASVTFTLTSPDGDEGFPGTVVAEVT